MTTSGSVRSWFSDEGWGVIDSPETPGGCWVHFDNVEISGYKELARGQIVNFDWEPADQDGYRFRAVCVWPSGTGPIENPPRSDPASAFSSTLTITFDRDPNHEQA